MKMPTPNIPKIETSILKGVDLGNQIEYGTLMPGLDSNEKMVWHCNHLITNAVDGVTEVGFKVFYFDTHIFGATVKFSGDNQKWEFIP